MMTDDVYIFLRLKIKQRKDKHLEALVFNGFSWLVQKRSFIHKSGVVYKFFFFFFLKNKEKKIKKI